MKRSKKMPNDYHKLAQRRKFEWLGPWVQKTSIKTAWKCSCSYVWEATYNNISAGKGCPLCGGSLPKNEKAYHDVAKDKSITWIGEVLPPNVKTKTAWRCDKGHTWESTYDSVRNSGQGCPQCGVEIRSKKRRAKSDFYKKLAQRKGLKWLGPLPKNHQGKTWWQCPVGHKWEASTVALKHTRLCPICNNRYPKTQDDYCALAKEKGIEWISASIPKTVQCKTKWRCNKGHEWRATYDSITRSGCPICYESKGESRISQVLDRLGVKYQRQYSFDQCRSDKGKQLYFDFFVILNTGQSFLIEYDGEQHFRSIKFYGGKEGFLRRKILDQRKSDFSNLINVPLLRIPYFEFDSIETILKAWIDQVIEGGMTGVSLGIQMGFPLDD